MKISVIITSFNAAKFLSKAIDSFLEQNYENKELVIIDDAGSDQTLPWLIETFSMSSDENSASNDQYLLYKGQLIEKEKKLKIKLLSNNSNQRFAAACNRAVLKASNSESSLTKSLEEILYQLAV